MSNKENLVRNLKSVGQRTFIKYFDVFRENCQEPKNENIKNSFSDEDWSENSRNSKAYSGKAIFVKEQEIEALNIIRNSSRVDSKTREMAEKLYNEYIQSEGDIDFDAEVKKTDGAKLMTVLEEYAAEQGLTSEDLYRTIIDRINSEINPDRFATLKESDKGWKFQVSYNSIASFVEIEETPTSEIKATKILALDDYKLEPNTKKKVYFDAKKIKNTFKSRLGTQNRMYTNDGLCYLPTLFKKINIDFNNTIETQISKVFTYTKISGQTQRVGVSEFEWIKIQGGHLMGKYKGAELELLFRANDEYHSFLGHIDKFGDVSLGHIKAMHSIMTTLKKSLPQIGHLAKVLTNSIVSIADIKLKRNSDAIATKIMDSSIDVVALKEEVALIEKEISMDLIPRRINSAMGKN